MYFFSKTTSYKPLKQELSKMNKESGGNPVLMSVQ